MTVLDLTLDPDIAATDRRRGHRFQPPAAAVAAIPGLYDTEDVDVDDTIVHVHYFAAGWDWWITELDTETWDAFGFVTSPLCPQGEWGYIPLTDLATLAMRIGTGVPVIVERDLDWQARPFNKVRSR